MADFWQQGTITVLQRLKNRPIEELEKEIEAIARRRRIVLLLPALYSEFETASMPRIVEELKRVKYLRQIVISLDRADGAVSKVQKFVSEIPFDVKIVWHAGPGMQALYGELKEANFNLDNPGKGQSVWMTLGYILSERDVYAVATHDCDIVNYNREMLARLVYLWFIRRRILSSARDTTPGSPTSCTAGSHGCFTPRLSERCAGSWGRTLSFISRQLSLCAIRRICFDRKPGQRNPHLAHLGP